MINISNLELYDKQAALNHVKALAFTRHAATEGETKAINYIRKELDKETIEYKLQSFEWSKSLRKLQKLIFLLIFLFISVNEILLLYPSFTWLNIPLNGLFLIVLILGMKNVFNYSRIVFIGKRKESNNIISTIQAKDLYPKRPVIFFSAHYDSISHNFSSKMTKILILSAIFLLVLVILINLILSIWSIIILFTAFQIEIIYISIRTISLIIGGVLLIEIFIAFFMKTTNVSFGSVDNASGVAILLELAKLIKKKPLEKIDVIFLWCGAEEMGLWGSKQYLSKHFEELDYDYDLNKSYNINIDMVGTYIGLVDETGFIKKKKINENLNDILKASDNQNRIPSEKTKLSFGTGSDHLVFQAFTKKAEKKGFQVSCFLSKKDAKYIHSKKDTPDLCSIENLNGCIDICYNAIKNIDLRVE